jgi:hypothetical protein
MGKSLEPEVYCKNSQVYYMRNGDIRYSFDMLEKVARSLGANLESGDILIVDNSRQNRRKVFKKTLQGAIQLYAYLFGENTFFSLRDRGNGVVEGKGKPIAQYLQY